jgi:hypothetical protein
MREGSNYIAMSVLVLCHQTGAVAAVRGCDVCSVDLLVDSMAVQRRSCSGDARR